MRNVKLMQEEYIEKTENTDLSWDIPEYVKHNRGKKWFISAIAVAVLLFIFAIFTANFLFAVIIVISSAVIYLNEIREPNRINFSIIPQGIVIGRKFYEYNQFKDFSILYKPHEELRNIYFEFKNGMKPRLSISLEEQNPLHIRKNLLRYLPEDLERINMPWSEGLAKLFKL